MEEAQRFEQLIRTDGRYPLEAYEFLYRGLDRAARARHGEAGDEAAPRHVSGQELCFALRELALEQWGALARTVLTRWNIARTRDFGEMVFLLVEHGLLGKQDSDRIEDFDDVYDFAASFERYEIPPLEQDAAD